MSSGEEKQGCKRTKQGVSDEENRERHEELIVVHVQVGSKAKDDGISNVGSV